MNSRLQKMIEKGKLPFRGGQWIDTYNQTTNPDIAGTILAGINSKNHYYIMEQIPINTDTEGMAIFKRDDSFGATGVIEKDGQCFRIRKLTPRECFRLMDVDDADIDKIQAAGISDSRQYKMAGNSIVVACLEKIFYKLFINKTITNKTLFDL